MKITVKRIDENEIQKLGVRKWPIWTKEISEFDWHYDTDEDCLLLEGRVRVETEGGAVTEFAAGDFVSFPQGDVVPLEDTGTGPKALPPGMTWRAR